VRFDGNGLWVEDANGVEIPLEQALAAPDKIGVIFFERSRALGGPECFGTFEAGNNPYREFIVGNENLVASWSLGTQEIRARLEADIAQLRAYLTYIRSTPRSYSDYQALVSCHSWHDAGEYEPYDAALAMPSPLYEPTPQNIARLIETLNADLPAIDALMVIRN
jgi:hypothetical protein